MVEYSDPRDFGFRPETVMTALMPYEQYSSKTRRLILGIDMGIASVGVCLIDISITKYVRLPCTATHVSFGKSRIDLSITSCLRQQLHVRLIGVVMVSLQF